MPPSQVIGPDTVFKRILARAGKCRQRRRFWLYVVAQLGLRFFKDRESPKACQDIFFGALKLMEKIRKSLEDDTKRGTARASN